jgi:hypothetical protein
VQCLASTDCKTATRPACDLTTDTCVECVTTAQCAGNAGPDVVCDTTGDAMANRCVECNTSAQCTTAGRPVCNPDLHACVPR